MKRPSPKICPISVDWSKLKIPNYAQVSLICSYYMLQSGELAVFNNSESFRYNQLGGKFAPTSHPH